MEESDSQELHHAQKRVLFDLVKRQLAFQSQDGRWIFGIFHEIEKDEQPVRLYLLHYLVQLKAPDGLM